MAPEQLRAEPLDARSDQFSWGVVAYELLVGRTPWAGATPDSLTLVHTILEDRPVDAAPLARSCPPAVARVVMRALSKQREERFDSMDRLVEELAPGQDGQGVPTPQTSAPLARRLPLATSIAMFLLCASAVFALTEPALFEALTGFFVSGQPEQEVESRLEEARRDRLVASADHRQYRFDPALVRDVIYGRVRGEDRLARHHLAAERLAAHYEGALDLHAATLARHFVRALPRSSPERALDLAMRAAKVNVFRGDYKRAARHWERAAGVLSHLRGERPRRVEVQLGLARAYAQIGQASAARDAFLDAVVLILGW